MSTLLRLRDYQEATIDALMKGWDNGASRLAAVLPTGAGKTVIFSHLSSGYVTANSGKRVLILAHTDELVRQAVRKLRDVAPHLKVGVVKAGENEVTATVVVASVQSLRSEKRRAQIRNVGLIIIDECHHATATTYREILEHYGCMGTPCRECLDGTEDPAPWCDCWDDETCKGPCRRRAHDVADCPTPPTKVAGFTATLIRGDKASLADIWQDVAYRKDISFMIRRGYLLPPKGKRIEVADLDLSKVRKSGGDYQVGDLGEALEASLAPEVVAEAYVEHAVDRPGLLFAPTVEAAYVFADKLNAAGIVTETVHGALPAAERRAILGRLESGETQVISNCMVLTEGFDSPKVSCVVIARPTRSSGLYQQMVGRGLRPDPARPRDGQDCLIIDVVGASEVHGLASLVDLSTKPIILRDGQTLIEAEDELEEKEGSARGKVVHDGPVVAVDFDPLADASSRMWLKTSGGTWFLSAGGGPEARYVFLVPAQPAKCECDGSDCDSAWPCSDGEHGEPGTVRCASCEAGIVAPDPNTWTVVWCRKTQLKGVEPGINGGITEHAGLSLDLAFTWGEDVAVDMGGMDGERLITKKSRWRKEAASDAQLGMLRRCGLAIPEGLTKGEASALIDTHMASQRIAPIALYFINKAKEIS